MIAVENIVGIVFRVINFGVLIGLAVYFFKKHALPIIKQQIADKQAFIVSLHNQEQMLEQEKEEVTKRIIEDEQQWMHLKDTFDQWRTTVSQVYAEHEKERQQRIRTLQDRAENRMQQVTSMRLSVRVFPQALEQAGAELQKYYADAQQADQFIKRIIDHMRAGKQ